MLTHHKKNTGWPLTLCSALLCSSLAQADDKGAVESLTGFNINETAPMKNLGINVGGWVSAGVAGNPDSPESRTNGPVTFNNRANEFNAHQLYGFIERAVDAEGSQWDLGFRADVVYGIDAFYTTQANFDDNLITDNSSRLYKLAFPQVYATVFAPVGNGITTKIGHFYTPHRLSRSSPRLITSSSLMPTRCNMANHSRIPASYRLIPLTRTSVFPPVSYRDGIRSFRNRLISWAAPPIRPTMKKLHWHLR